MSDPEIKLVRVTGQLDALDDPSLPWLVHVNLSPPPFMEVTFVMLYGGSEEIVARCTTRAAVDRLLDEGGLRNHARLRWIRVKGPDGRTEEIKPAPLRATQEELIP